MVATAACSWPGRLALPGWGTSGGEQAASTHSLGIHALSLPYQWAVLLGDPDPNNSEVPLCPHCRLTTSSQTSGWAVEANRELLGTKGRGPGSLSLTKREWNQRPSLWNLTPGLIPKGEKSSCLVSKSLFLSPPRPSLLQ